MAIEESKQKKVPKKLLKGKKELSTTRGGESSIFTGHGLGPIQDPSPDIWPLPGISL